MDLDKVQVHWLSLVQVDGCQIWFAPGLECYEVIDFVDIHLAVGCGVRLDNFNVSQRVQWVQWAHAVWSTLVELRDLGYPGPNVVESSSSLKSVERPQMGLIPAC